eukprot:m.66420 g.66420  ORF g.66420 m.66420 type:complete len:109 (+) comp23687_c0_seq2:561-887(+)
MFILAPIEFQQRRNIKTEFFPDVDECLIFPCKVQAATSRNLAIVNSRVEMVKELLIQWPTFVAPRANMPIMEVEFLVNTVCGRHVLSFQRPATLAFLATVTTRDLLQL